MAYNNGSGGCVHLPSPTNMHHADLGSIARSVRRSLSRSPSKFRLRAKSPSQSPKSPLSPSPVRQQSYPNLHTPSPLVPFPPSKLTLRSIRKPAPIRPSPSTRTSPRSPIKKSPRSPIKRALSESSDSGNSMPGSALTFGFGQENHGRKSAENYRRKSGSISPAERHSFEKMFNSETTVPVHHFMSRLGGDGANDYNGGLSSPLKRSDAIMNLDQASLGSPVAKRRSLHGATAFGHDFNVVEQEKAAQAAAAASAFEIHDEGSQEYELSASSVGSPFGNMPRRSSSLRKSTLQQRTGEKTSWGRKHAQDLATIAAAQEPAELSTPAASKSRPRLSLDQFLPPVPRNSPFTDGSLPNASMHVVQPKPGNGQHGHQPHPLSRQMTQSSSNSSLADDSPVRVPMNFGNYPPRPKIDFSASLPAGGLRSFALDPARKESMKNPSANESFSTPQNYKLVKPHPAAFMSTGLISKVNRHPEAHHGSIHRGGKGNMPDTPCKKPVFNTIPTGSVISKGRHIRHSFGTPSTPFNPHGIPPSQGTFGKLSNIFGSNFGKENTRRSSFLSTDGDDCASPENHDGQAGPESDLPPTPTKPALAMGGNHNGGTPYSIRGLPPSTSAFGMSKKAPRMSTSPLERVDFMERISPRTPQESMVPPDPSGLSISNHKENKTLLQSASRTPTMLPPATPTAERDYFGRRNSTTPINGFASTKEMDHSLSSRFDKVELIGTGEFSQVYKATKTNQPRNVNASFYFGGSPTPNRSPSSPLPDQVFAVKKARQPFAGARDRLRKLQEVQILKQLGKSNHVIQHFDSWEEQNHLYIQTEYCEEGALDVFLSNIGRKGRLDDFRIWKILLELSLGLKHVHDSGFMHLDLKPANIFITFEGVLKIGDFGMATTWPAPPHMECEGDREYIGPEILMGRYDKPSDVFSLGLIMLEIAGNVELPDNGPTWQKLRSGDLSDVPSLTSAGSSLIRDADGIPTGGMFDTDMDVDRDDDDMEGLFGSPTAHRHHHVNVENLRAHDAADPFGPMKRAELLTPPPFMKFSSHEGALDSVVKWMISPSPDNRPTINQVLATEGVQWALQRRRAGATVFEGNWGPADCIFAPVDSEMTDV